MSSLSGNAVLTQLKQRFLEVGGEQGLTKDQFVRVMLDVLPDWRAMKGDLATAEALIDKFLDIDVDGNGLCEWSEFLAYTIEAGIVATRRPMQPVSHRFAHNDRFVDTTSRAPIMTVAYLPLPLDCMMVIEERSSKVRLYHANTMRHIADIDSVSQPIARPGLVAATSMSGANPVAGGGGVSTGISATSLVAATSSTATLPATHDAGHGGGGGVGTGADGRRRGGGGQYSVPGAVIAAARRDKAGLGDDIAPFINAALLIPNHGLIAVAQSNNLIALWTSSGLAAHATASTTSAGKVGEEVGGKGRGMVPPAAASLASSAVAADTSHHTVGRGSGGGGVDGGGASSGPRGRGGRSSFSLFSFTCAATLHVGPSPALRLAWGGGVLFSSSFSSIDHTSVVSVWDVQDVSLLARFRAHTDAITDMLAIPQHNVLVTTSLDRSLWVYHLRDWTLEADEPTAGPTPPTLPAGSGVGGPPGAGGHRHSAATLLSGVGGPPSSTGTGLHSPTGPVTLTAKAMKVLAANSGAVVGVDMGSVPGALPLAAGARPPNGKGAGPHPTGWEEGPTSGEGGGVEGEGEPHTITPAGVGSGMPSLRPLVAGTRQALVGTGAPATGRLSQPVVGGLDSASSGGKVRPGVSAGGGSRGVRQPSRMHRPTATVSAEAVDPAAAGYRVLSRMAGHAQGVRQVVFIPSADMLLTASFEADALGWDLNTMKQVLRLRGHRVPLVGVAEVPNLSLISPDGSSGGEEVVESKEEEEDAGLAGLPKLTALMPGGGTSSFVTRKVRRVSGSDRSRCLTLDLAGIAKLWDLAPSFTGLAPCLMTIDLNILTSGVSPPPGASGWHSFDTAHGGGGGGTRAPAPGGGEGGGAHSHPTSHYSSTSSLMMSLGGGHKPARTGPTIKEMAASGAAAAAAAAQAAKVVEPGRAVPRSFTIALSTGVLVVGGVRLQVFNSVRVNLDSAVQHWLSAAVWNPVTRTFLVASDRTVRVFDVTGKRVAQWYNIVPSPITALITDDRRRKIIMGTQHGAIYVHNFSNGALMKVAEAQHSREITAMHYVPVERTIATVSWDRSCIIHDETPQHALEALRYYDNMHAGDITAVAASGPDAVGLLATGSTDFTIKLHDYTTARLEAVCEGHVGEITALAFIEGYPLLLSTDTTGTHIIWGLRPCMLSQLYRPLLAFKNLNPQDDKRGEVGKKSRRDGGGGREGDATTLLHGSAIDRTLAFCPPITAITMGVVPWPVVDDGSDAPPPPPPPPSSSPTRRPRTASRSMLEGEDGDGDVDVGAEVGVDEEGGMMQPAPPPAALVMEPAAPRMKLVPKRVLVSCDDNGRVKVWDLGAAVSLIGVTSLDDMMAAAMEEALSPSTTTAASTHPDATVGGGGALGAPGTAPSPPATASSLLPPPPPTPVSASRAGSPTKAEYLASLSPDVLSMARTMATRRRSITLSGAIFAGTGDVMSAFAGRPRPASQRSNRGGNRRKSGVASLSGLGEGKFGLTNEHLNLKATSDGGHVLLVGGSAAASPSAQRPGRPGWAARGDGGGGSGNEGDVPRAPPPGTVGGGASSLARSLQSRRRRYAELAAASGRAASPMPSSTADLSYVMLPEGGRKAGGSHSGGKWGAMATSPTGSPMSSGRGPAWDKGATSPTAGASTTLSPRAHPMRRGSGRSWQSHGHDDAPETTVHDGRAEVRRPASASSSQARRPRSAGSMRHRRGSTSSGGSVPVFGEVMPGDPRSALHPRRGRSGSLTQAVFEHVLRPNGGAPPAPSDQDGGGMGGGVGARHRSARRRRSSFADLTLVARALVASVERTPDIPLLAQWQGHTDVIKSVQLVPDHDPPCLMTAAQDGTVRLWNVTTGEPLGNLVPIDTLGPLPGGVSPVHERGKVGGSSGLNLRLPWRFRVDADTEAAARRQDAAAVLTAIARSDVEAADRVRERQERQAKLKMEMAAAGRSVPPTTAAGGRATSAFAVTRAVGLDDAATAEGIGAVPLDAVPLRPGLTLGSLLSPSESRRIILSLGPAAPPSVIGKVVGDAGHAAAGSTAESRLGGGELSLDDDVETDSLSPGSRGGGDGMALQPADAQFMAARRETMSLLQDLIDSSAARDVPNEEERGGEDGGQGGGAGGQGGGADGDGAVSLSFDDEDDEEDVAALMGDGMLAAGIVETTAATRRIGKKQATRPATSIEVAQQYAQLVSISTDALLDSLSNERKAATLLAAHLATTGQRPLMESYASLQAEKRRGVGVGAGMGSSASAAHGGGTATHGGGGGGSKGAPATTTTTTTTSYRLQFTATGEVDTTPSEFLRAKLGMKPRSQPSLGALHATSSSATLGMTRHMGGGGLGRTGSVNTMASAFSAHSPLWNNMPGGPSGVASPGEWDGAPPSPMFRSASAVGMVTAPQTAAAAQAGVAPAILIRPSSMYSVAGGERGDGRARLPPLASAASSHTLVSPSSRRQTSSRVASGALEDRGSAALLHADASITNVVAASLTQMSSSAAAGSKVLGTSRPTGRGGSGGAIPVALVNSLIRAKPAAGAATARLGSADASGSMSGGMTSPRGPGGIPVMARGLLTTARSMSSMPPPLASATSSRSPCDDVPSPHLMPPPPPPSPTPHRTTLYDRAMQRQAKLDAIHAVSTGAAPMSSILPSALGTLVEEEEDGGATTGGRQVGEGTHGSSRPYRSSGPGGHPLQRLAPGRQGQRARERSRIRSQADTILASLASLADTAPKGHVAAA